MKKLIIIIFLINCNKSIKELVTRNKVGEEYWQYIMEDKVQELQNYIEVNKNKIDINKDINENGEIAITLASKCNSLNVLNFLLSQSEIDINKTNKKGQTTLIAAILDSEDSLERDEIIDKLLENGSNTNLAYGTSGNNTLMLAILKEDLYTINKILKANIDINYTNIFEETALTLAAKSDINQDKKLKIIEKLLNKGNIKLNKEDVNGKTALCYSLLQDNFSDVLSRLFERKINLIYYLKNQNLDYIKKILKIIDLKVASNYTLKYLLKEEDYLFLFNKIKNLTAKEQSKILDFIFFKIIENKDITYKNRLLELGKKDTHEKTIFDYITKFKYKKVTPQIILNILKYKHNFNDLKAKVFLSDENKIRKYFNSISNDSYEVFCESFSRIIHINTEETALELVELLDPEIEINTREYETFLHLAVRNGCMNLIKRLIEIFPSLSYTKGKISNQVPLFEIVSLYCPRSKRLLILEEFLKLKNIKIEEYSSFLFTAVLHKETEIVERLLKIPNIEVQHKNHYNQNCLSSLLFHELLLKEKNIKDFYLFDKEINKHNKFLLQKRQILPLVELLIKNKINIEEKDSLGRTTLDYILLLPHVEEYLKERGILKNINRDKIKFLDTTKLIEIIEKNDVDSIKEIEANDITLSGHNIIHYIAYFGLNEELLKNLLGRSITKNLNALDYFWQTPLTFAINSACEINEEICSLIKNTPFKFRQNYNEIIISVNPLLEQEILNKLNLLNKKLKMALLLFNNGGRIHVHEEVIKGDAVPSLGNLMNIYKSLRALFLPNIINNNILILNINLLNELFKKLINDESTLIFLPCPDYNTILDLAILNKNDEIVKCIIENRNKKFYISDKFQELSNSQKQNITAKIEGRGILFDSRKKRGVDFTFYEAAIRGYYSVLERILEEVPGAVKDRTLEEILSILRRVNVKIEFKLEVEKMIISELRSRGLV